MAMSALREEGQVFIFCEDVIREYLIDDLKGIDIRVFCN